MNYLLISGPKDSGKTTLHNMLLNYYTSPGRWNIVDIVRYGVDFRAILEKKSRYILIQSDTDVPACIANLKNYFLQYPKVDLIITSCKNEPEPMRHRLFLELDITNPLNYHVEIPIGRMPRGQGRSAAIGWYLDALEKIAITIGTNVPFLL